MKVNRDLVRQLRLEKSWSQEKLAEQAGVSLRTVQRVETDGVASLQSRGAIAKALGVEPAAITYVAGSSGDSPAPAPKPVLVVSRFRFLFLRTTQVIATSLLWVLMALVVSSAFVMAFGGVFFWELTDPPLSHSQSAGGGILSALLLVPFFLLFRALYRVVRRTEILRREAPEPAGK